VGGYVRTAAAALAELAALLDSREGIDARDLTSVL
jgi:hypothetical protein